MEGTVHDLGLSAMMEGEEHLLLGSVLITLSKNVSDFEKQQSCGPLSDAHMHTGVSVLFLSYSGKTKVSV